MGKKVDVILFLFLVLANVGCAINSERMLPLPGLESSAKGALPCPSSSKAVPLTFCYIPAGKFMMGSPDKEEGRRKDEGPRHKVHITKAFWMGKYEVTNAQFEAFVKATNYVTDAEKKGDAFGWNKTENGYGMVKGLNWKNPGVIALGTTDEKAVIRPNEPVCVVSWNDATAFCKWASEVTKNEISLPTEAQWEYACRAGCTTKFWWGDSEYHACRYANVGNEVYKNSKGYYKNLTYFPCEDKFIDRALVGQFEANALGLHDMTGNLSEWCNDWYDKVYYASSAKEDPLGAEKGEYRVLRGGSWVSGPVYCRVALRRLNTPEGSDMRSGFRVVRTP